MAKTARFIDALVSKIGIPLLAMSGIALHGFTVWTVFRLAPTGPSQYFAAIVAYMFPPISQMVGAYLAWRSTGSVINAYSVWLLLWLLLLLITWLLVRVSHRLSRHPAASA
jgi:hypothetical protein